MKYIKFITALLAIPLMLVQMKIEHSRMKRQNKKNAPKNVYTDNNLLADG